MEPNEIRVTKPYNERIQKQECITIPATKEYPLITIRSRGNDSYKFFINKNRYQERQIKLLTIMSGKYGTSGHRYRIDFLQELCATYPNIIDVYGLGVDRFSLNGTYKGYIPGWKYNTAKNYQYQLCCENSSQEGYVSEKITDAILTLNMPIYWGCPNIYDYLPKESLIPIDITNKENIHQIPYVVQAPITKDQIEALLEARNRILTKYNLWTLIYIGLKTYL